MRAGSGRCARSLKYARWLWKVRAGSGRCALALEGARGFERCACGERYDECNNARRRAKTRAEESKRTLTSWAALLLHESGRWVPRSGSYILRTRLVGQARVRPTRWSGGRRRRAGGIAAVDCARPNESRGITGLVLVLSSPSQVPPRTQRPMFSDLTPLFLSPSGSGFPR